MPRVTGWNDGLCQDYDRRLGKWFADRLGARHQLRKEFDMIEQAKQVAQRLSDYDSDGVSPMVCSEGSDMILALVAEVESLRKDAERYRFWRDRYPITFAPTDMTPEDVDRATDAAINAAMQGVKE